MKFLLPLLAILFLPFTQARADAPTPGYYDESSNVYQLRTARPARYEERLRRDYRAFQREQAAEARYLRTQRARAARIAEERRYRAERRLSARELRRREALALAEENRRYERQRRRYAEGRAERRQVRDAEYGGGALCKPTLSVTGPIKKGRARAEEAARQVWQAEVSATHNRRYASTRRAQQKRYSCDDIPGVWLGYSCQFRARPCRAEF